MSSCSQISNIRPKEELGTKWVFWGHLYHHWAILQSYTRSSSKWVRWYSLCSTLSLCLSPRSAYISEEWHSKTLLPGAPSQPSRSTPSKSPSSEKNSNCKVGSQSVFIFTYWSKRFFLGWYVFMGSFTLWDSISLSSDCWFFQASKEYLHFSSTSFSCSVQKKRV